ncbi:MAG: hypothetical protein PHV54_01620 [Tolumonas sp.]|nr:hypothetical protein [Tolumonas sp.]
MQASRKVEGPRVRESAPFIALLNNACFSLNSNPNAGTPLLLKMALRKIRDDDPDEFSRIVRSAARDAGVSTADVIQTIND